ncbi:MAG: hypothetical protein COT74_14015 [Bdellovibrionales bacterium CG10_big_fil_rev_8_21_14_0_10_45_34]|nr:MAG: hypothetical protein COT74_14015 [Bdellovibrionales bacterium CG10_big_fil_rev_8_21_14_0_10_45_34]
MSKEKRRFPRIYLPANPEETDRLADVSFLFEGLGPTPILDISLKGLCIRRVAAIHSEIVRRDGRPIKFGLEFLGLGLGEFEGRVVRTTEDAIAFEFTQLGAEAHKLLSCYFEMRSRGLQTRFVSPQFYAPEQDFTHWFHGPGDTNVFVWLQDKAIRRFVVEFDYGTLNFENAKLTLATSRADLTRATEDYTHYVTVETRGSTMPEASFVRRVIELLEQIPDEREIISLLVETLKCHDSSLKA